MLSAYLVRLVEQHASALTGELVDDLLHNERTPTFHTLSRDELHHRLLGIYSHIGEWLADTSDASIEARFEALGRQRFHERCPSASWCTRSGSPSSTCATSCGTAATSTRRSNCTTRSS